MQEIVDFIKANLTDAKYISILASKQAVRDFGISLKKFEQIVLTEGYIPLRYKRNSNTFGPAEQLRFLQSHVTVIGCGGLGGYIFEQLLRLGVGSIRIVDRDVFEEHNLNRQILSTVDALGKPKVQVAKEKALQINPASTVQALQIEFNADTAEEILANTDVVVDALDSISARLTLVKECRQRGLHLIHGSIGGYFGQVSTGFGGDTALDKLFEGRHDRGIEEELGNPSFTPAVVASLQVVETINVLLNKPPRLHRRLLYVDLQRFVFKTLML